MIISAPADFRRAAKRRLPPFLFHYIDGGAYAEHTLASNQTDLARVSLRQRVLKDMQSLSLETEVLGEKLAMPVLAAPVGIAGMYARRGETQVARAVASRGINYVVPTLSVCPLEEVAASVDKPLWLQLYVLKDRAFAENLLQRAAAVGIQNLLFTVDMPIPGARYRDRHSGMSGPYRSIRRVWQAMRRPRWALDVGLRGRPHDLGNISAYRGFTVGLEDYMGYLADNFDPSIAWKDLEWLRGIWPGKIVIKGVLDPVDAREAVRCGVDGIVVSNHGGRQLDGVLSTARALPAIADAVKGEIAILADSGIQSGLDVVRMLALGADAVLSGKAVAYALAAGGQQGVEHLFDLFQQEMRVAMTLTGAHRIDELSRHSLIWENA